MLKSAVTKIHLNFNLNLNSCLKTSFELQKFAKTQKKKIKNLLEDNKQPLRSVTDCLSIESLIS